MSEVQAQEYQRLQALSSEAARAGNRARMMELQDEAYNLATYEPLMSLSLEQGYCLVDARQQVLGDYDQFLEISEWVSEAILPEPPEA